MLKELLQVEKKKNHSYQQENYKQETKNKSRKQITEKYTKTSNHEKRRQMQNIENAL